MPDVIRLRPLPVLTAALLGGCAAAPPVEGTRAAAPPALEDAALAAFNAGDYQGACDRYTALAAEQPGRPDLWGAASLAAARSGRPDDALAARRRARALDPRNPWHRLRAARLLLAAGRFEEALAETEPPGDAWDHLTRAQALRRLGRPEDALVALDRAAAADPVLALVHQEKAEVFDALGRPAEAATAYAAALGLDASAVHLQLRLARAEAQAGNSDAAYERYRRGLLVDPGDPAAVAGRAALVAALPRLAERDRERESVRERAWRAYAPPPLPPLPPAPLSPLAVGLVPAASSFRARVGGTMLLDPGDGCAILLRAGQDLSGTSPGGKLVLSWEGGSATPLGEARLMPYDPASAFGLFNVHFEKGAYWSDEENRFYRGTLSIRPLAGGCALVNVVPLEDYLLSVVPSEMPSDWPLEALKAQAVAARSETLTKLRRHAKDGFNVCATQHCAVYRGGLSERKRTTEAVQSTHGVILAGSGGPLDAVYAANCGGWGSAAGEVWGSGARHLRAVCDLPQAARREWTRVSRNPDERERFLYARPPAWCSHRAPSAAFRWTRSYALDELASWTARRHKVENLSGVRVTSSTREGWVTGILLEGDPAVDVKRDAVRPALRMVRSNFFALERIPGGGGVPVQILLTGGGWGHGVGMCQDGAFGMAGAGKGYARILAQYYPGAILTGIY